MARMYARVVGFVLLLVGVVGLLLAEEALLGFVNIDVFEDVVHLVTGKALTYAGFAVRHDVVTGVVGALGAVYLLGVLGFVLPDLFGLLPHEYSAFDNVLHLVLGGLALAAVAASRRTTAAA